MPRTTLLMALALSAAGISFFALLYEPAPVTPVAVPSAPVAFPLAAPPAPSNAAPIAAAGVIPGAARHDVTIPAVAPEQNVIELWDSSSLVPEKQDDMTLYHTQVPVAAIGSLAVGKTLQLAVPGRKEPLRATLDETHNNGAAVWSGSVQGGQAEDSLTVVRGQLETHITLATRDKTLSFVVDNATGKTLMTDQNELLMRATPDALITPESTLLQPLPPPTSG
ncbi:hypothetical protein GCM10017655_09260 [Pseudomonas turukhanskensis]|uniref:Uncharacterized protein n=1 Tax=Pseudomonas turukhanskensis TaxID=1806536 RepID=A0A9W6NDQ5_9PSED|nr:hypothetical protein GCM10017655_09260 [Pseudomonas turukhanskensis]